MSSTQANKETQESYTSVLKCKEMEVESSCGWRNESAMFHEMHLCDGFKGWSHDYTVCTLKVSCSELQQACNHPRFHKVCISSSSFLHLHTQLSSIIISLFSFISFLPLHWRSSGKLYERNEATFWMLPGGSKGNNEFAIPSLEETIFNYIICKYLLNVSSFLSFFTVT